MGLVVAVLCRGARYRAFPNSKRGFSAFSSTTGRGLKRDTKGGERSAGGDGGIRTLDRALQPYNGLANRRLQPLGHISRRNARATYARGIPPLQAHGDRGSGYRDPHPSHSRGAGAEPAARGAMVEIRWRRPPRPAPVRGHANHRSWTEIRAPISNAKHEQADQARPNRRQPRLISRYVGTRKPIRRRATCPTILRSALASLSCALLARA